MSKKKLLWIIILIVFIIAVGVAIYFANTKGNKQNSNVVDNTYNKNMNVVNEMNENKEIEEETTETVVYQKKELDDGILYSIDGKEYKSDIVIGENYYDTTINDIYLNPENYMNKNIEIEGMYLENLPWTFVGRYSTSNVCVYCPEGYSYMEYQLKGNIDREFTAKEDWIKVIGTLAKGNDETSDFQDYYYLEVLSIEVMNERGVDTVNN
jgi:uncharacterized protein (UPF0333 family)